MNDYEVITFDVPFLKELRMKVAKKYYIQEGRATVYILKDKTSILVPHSGNKLVKFSNEDDLHNILASQGIPIDDPHILWVQRDIVNNWANNRETLLEKLSDLLEINIEISVDVQYLNNVAKEINRYIKKHGQEKAYMDLYFPLGRFVGELFISLSKGHAEWRLIETYCYNTRYYPTVFIDDIETSFWNGIDQGLSRKRMNLPKTIYLGSSNEKLIARNDVKIY